MKALPKTDDGCLIFLNWGALEPVAEEAVASKMAPRDAQKPKAKDKGQGLAWGSFSGASFFSSESRQLGGDQDQQQFGVHKFWVKVPGVWSFVDDFENTCCWFLSNKAHQRCERKHGRWLWWFLFVWVWSAVGASSISISGWTEKWFWLKGVQEALQARIFVWLNI